MSFWKKLFRKKEKSLEEGIREIADQLSKELEKPPRTCCKCNEALENPDDLFTGRIRLINTCKSCGAPFCFTCWGELTHPPLQQHAQLWPDPKQLERDLGLCPVCKKPARGFIP